MAISTPPNFTPPGYGPTEVTEMAAPRKLRHEETINRQVQLITYLRSTQQPFSEAVMALRSCVIGLEDQAFNDAWAAWPCNAVHLNGAWLYQPSPVQAAQAQDLLMALLARWGMTFDKKIVSKTPKVPRRDVLPELQDAVEAGP